MKWHIDNENGDMGDQGSLARTILYSVNTTVQFNVSLYPANSMSNVCAYTLHFLYLIHSKRTPKVTKMIALLSLLNCFAAQYFPTSELLRRPVDSLHTRLQANNPTKSSHHSCSTLLLSFLSPSEPFAPHFGYHHPPSHPCCGQCL